MGAEQSTPRIDREEAHRLRIQERVNYELQLERQRDEADRLRMKEREAYEAILERQRKNADRLRMKEREAYEAKLERQNQDLAEQRAKVILEQQKTNYNLKLKGVETQPVHYEQYRSPYSVTLSTSSHHGNQEGYQAKPRVFVNSNVLTSPAPPVSYKPAVGSSSVLTSPAPPVSYKPAVESSSVLTSPAPPVSYKPAVESSSVRTSPAPPVSYKPAVGSSSVLTSPALPASVFPDQNKLDAFKARVDRLFQDGHAPSSAASSLTNRWTPSAPSLSDQAAVGSARTGTKHILDELLKCRNCYDKISGLTVFQCSFGHSACEKCKYENCGACGGPITEKKNTATIAIEAAKTKLTVPCTWQASGCKLLLQSNDLDLHVKGCPFRDIPCPISAILKCSWQGNKSQLASHFQECHHQHCNGNAGTEMYLFNVDKSSQVINLVTLDPCYFLVLVKVDSVQGRLHMAVQLIGTMADAGQYTYEFHVYNKNEPNRKFLLTDVCRSIYTPMDETFHETKTVSVPLSYATTFVNNNRVCYKLYIQKTDGDAAIKVGRRYGKNTAKGPNRNQNQD